MKLKVLFFIGVFLLVFLSGCMRSVDEIKSEEFINKKVAVRGVVEGSVKLGDLSGFVIVDGDGDSIFVSSNSLPGEGSTIVARGILKRSLLGYYIDSKN
jgi:hypothetical protein